MKLSLDGIGWTAISCASNQFEYHEMEVIYADVTMGLYIIAVLIITIHYYLPDKEF